MKKAVIILVCFGIFGLSSCKRVSNEFIIHDPEGVVSSAELRLCDERLQLTKSEGQISGKMLITCEGAGTMQIRLSDGRETACHIGYVTPGSELNFEYVVANGQCQGVLGQRPDL
jgi:hypothetical protein